MMIQVSYHQGYMRGKMSRMIQAMRCAWERGEKTMMVTPRQCRIVPRKLPEMIVYDEAHSISDLEWKLLEELIKEK